MRAPAPEITFAVPGDLHLTEPGRESFRDALRAIDEIEEVIRPDFVQFIGDNVQDAEEGQFLLFDALRRRLTVPHFALVGDHDVKGDPSAEGFRRHVGETFGAMSLGGFRFLRLNTQEARPLGISARQVEWFRGEVDAALSGGERVVVFQHNYPFQIWETFDGPGIAEWREVVQTRPIAAIICGHTHYWQVANDGRNVAIATRSIGDPEGGAPGFAVGCLSGEDLAVAYRAVDEEGPLALVIHPREALLATGPAHVVRGADEIRVRTWSRTPVGRVLGRIDGGEPFPLKSAGEGLWTARLPGDLLARGEHSLDVEAIDGDGRKGLRQIRFPVDPTGRFTAVPSARPVVDRTDFC